MLNSEYHRLLRRQLKKTNPELLENTAFVEFLDQVNDAYKSFDKDVLHIENILEQSSKELFATNTQLKHERDVTKVRLKNLVDNIGGVIFETDLSGNFTFLNSAWETYSGFTVKESLGKNYLDFLVSDAVQSDIDINKTFGRNKRYIKFIFKHFSEDKEKWFELRAKAFKEKSGSPAGFVGSITDVTTLKETEIELQRASAAKDEFLSTMSHEIRTPLNAVTGLTNILLMEEYLPEQVDHLKALKYSGEHLLGLINDLLDFSKIKSGKMHLVEKDFSLKQLLENLRADFSLRAEKRGVVFHIVKYGNVPNNIIGDELKLTQILKNLLSNALKFTEKGSISLHVKDCGIDRNKVRLQFMVIDTGIGISKQKQETIFESFMQANDDTSIKYGGTGLGLAISKKLLQLQQSDLDLQSEEGKGSCFSFKISYKVSNRLNTFKPDMVKAPSAYEPLDINVLVAEDNKMNVLILRKFFQKWNINFKVAENGKEVLEYFEAKNFNFDLVFMDLQMPVLDGYKTTRVIRNMEDENKSTIPIIALTAFAQTDIKAKTKRYGMNGFMSKPFNPAELYSVLKSYSKPHLQKDVG